ncbi:MULTISPECIES: bifunctional hydroxymethylpyrimidine kinase/phosphomethylpyrimidine kinase [Sphingomonas]|uniref:bifunctional hydroxymethylpyrimidine kinase/phosphomethylpyrimidine kinase n=1 Tax=Sphingomonas TaxID=13687 RepID=UPI00082BFF40|nr:bifunctional hydroxymethylpyrimidine kinase/phosphomethylpyrimidine kinase [Sphingomonas sp. CCH10-B3]MBA3880203.1 bifunctional hydroxymethylpyrimidine kinase/phosphomethylpyrimidine kinase [Sphingobium sp.]
MTPRILIIAGSDSGGGAGIQADIKTVTMLGGHAMTAVTAITAQNTLGVQLVAPVSPDVVAEQMASVLDDIGVDAIKIGMLPNEEVVRIVAGVLLAWRGPPERWLPGTRMPVPVVLDPVLVATSGDALADTSVARAIVGRLMPFASLVTPNHHEARILFDIPGFTDRGVPILYKGGDAAGDEITDTLFGLEGDNIDWTAKRIETTSTHGTGCTLASAIATYLAYGYPLQAAVARARQFVRIALKDAPGFGGGHGPMGHQKVRLDLGPGVRLNQVTVPMAAGSEAFYRTLGLTQIVDTEDGHYARFEAAGGATLSVEHGAAPTIFFECEDLDAEVARLLAAGVVFDHLPTEQEWLWREARLTDPAGNAICLYQADENRRFPPWRLAR